MLDPDIVNHTYVNSDIDDRHAGEFSSDDAFGLDIFEMGRLHPTRGAQKPFDGI